MHQFVTTQGPLRRIARPTPTARGDRGEGVISTAIAVLVMAFLGAAMWVTFNTVWKDTSQTTEDQVRIIGTDSEAPPAPAP